MIAAVVLAAGRGTRMESDKAKVLHCVGDRTMLFRVLQQAYDSGISNIVLVAGHQCGTVVAEACRWSSNVEINCKTQKPNLFFCLQRQQLGTAHAVQQAVSTLEEIEADRVVVLSGDVPLLTARTIGRLLQTNVDASCTVLSVIPSDNYGFGRIIRCPETGNLLRIVEERDCMTEEERNVVEVNAGVYVFDRKPLCAVLKEINNCNSQNEYYLTDAVRLLVNHGHKVSAVLHDGRVEEALGVNNTEQLRNANDYWKNHCL